MRFDRLKNFITEEERLAILDWFNNNLSNPNVFALGMNGNDIMYTKRFTTRRVEKPVTFPEVIHNVFDKIVELYGDRPKQRLVTSNGLIAVATLPDGETYLHTDPFGQGSQVVVTFNVLIQSPDKGGLLMIGEPLETKLLEEKELHCYAASCHQHKVTRVEGLMNRYMLIFRMIIPMGEWEPCT